MIEIEFYEHLKQNVILLENRVFALVMPQDTPKPCAAYSVAEKIGKSGCSENNPREWEVTAYAEKYKEVKEVKEQIVTAIKSFRLITKDITVTDDFDPERGLFVQIIKFRTGKKE